MTDLEIRLNKIEKSCLEAARKDLKNIKEENDEYVQEKKLEAINDYKDVLANNYKRDLEKMNRDFNKKVFDYEVEVRKNLNDYKEKLIRNIYYKAKDEMEKFVSSRSYKKYLMNNIEEAISNSKDAETTVFLTERDYTKYKKDVEKKYNVKIEKIENEKIGGCYIVDKKNKISIDNTILTNIEEEIKKIDF